MLRSRLAWIVLLAAVVVAVFLLGPALLLVKILSMPHEELSPGRLMRCGQQLAYASASLVWGAVMFRIIRSFPVLDHLTVGLAVLALVLGVTPSIVRFIDIDRCLDSGGRWNYASLQCEH